MAAFIENDNQKLLWNTLHNVPLFLNNVEESQRPILFKQIIGEFYQKNRFRALNKNDLDLLNRNVISHFMELLKKAFVNNGLAPKERLPNAKVLGETSLMFLIHPTITKKQMYKYAEIIKKVLLNAQI